jgi:hypothetical protein
MTQGFETLLEPKIPEPEINLELSSGLDVRQPSGQPYSQGKTRV